MKILLVIFAFLTAICVYAQQDQGHDYPFFNRIEGFYITKSIEQKGATYDFYNPTTGNQVSITGNLTSIQYKKKTDAPDPSSFEIKTVYFNSTTSITKFQKDASNIFYQIKIFPSNSEVGKPAGVYQQIWVHEMVQSDKKGYTLILITEPVGFAEVRQELTKLESSGRAELYTIYFKTDKYQYEPQSELTIKEIVDYLEQEKDMHVKIVGSADTTGGKEHNQELSEKRAEYIKKAIIKRGISASRLTSVGAGETDDKKHPVREKELELNRRTVLIKE